MQPVFTILNFHVQRNPISVRLFKLETMAEWQTDLALMRSVCSSQIAKPAAHIPARSLGEWPYRFRYCKRDPASRKMTGFGPHRGDTKIRLGVRRTT